MEMLRDEARKEKLKVRRCVTIATPHAGVAWRGPLIGIGATNLRRGSKLLEAHAGYALKLPTLSVFSSHDNIVHPKETSHLVKRGGRDIEVEGIAHLSILFSPVVASHVASFLLEPGPAAPEAQVVPTAAVITEPARASVIGLDAEASRTVVVGRDAGAASRSAARSARGAHAADLDAAELGEADLSSEAHGDADGGARGGA